MNCKSIYVFHHQIQREAFVSLGLVSKSAEPVLNLMQSLNFSYFSALGACAALSDMARLGYTYSTVEANQALSLVLEVKLKKMSVLRFRIF